MRILVIGSQGQLGWELMNRAEKWGFDRTGYDLPELDIRDAEATHRVVSKNDVSVVVNAAAYTAVDKAEEEREKAFAVNCDGVAGLARACLDTTVPLIHISTDYVFDGRRREPYLEADEVSPLGVYGLSKAAGEQAVQKILREHIIVRTAWLCGLRGNNFVKTMLHLGKERGEVRIVADQFGCPTFAGDLADAILKVISVVQEDPDPRWGIYHYCGDGVASWYEFATEIFKLANQYDSFPTRVVPITTKEFPTLAERPSYSVLDCSQIKSRFGVKTRPWREGLAEMLNRFLGE